MSITQQINIASSQEQVWHAWLESDRITKWFSPAAEIEAAVNGKFELYFDPTNKDSMSTKGCRILQLEPYDSFTFQWKGPDPFAEVMNQLDHLTQVKVTLEPINNGTSVTVNHNGWVNTQSTETQKAIVWHDQAWADMLSSLKGYLESTTK